MLIAAFPLAASAEDCEARTDALRAYLKLGRETGDPEPKHAHYRLGQILAKAERKDEARIKLQIALKIDPKFKEAKEALAAL